MVRVWRGRMDKGMGTGIMGTGMRTGVGTGTGTGGSRTQLHNLCVCFRVLFSICRVKVPFPWEAYWSGVTWPAPGASCQRSHPRA